MPHQRTHQLIYSYLLQLSQVGIHQIPGSPDALRNLDMLRFQRPDAPAPARIAPSRNTPAQQSRSVFASATAPEQPQIPQDDSWELLERDMADCNLCALGRTRTRIVPGDGNRQASLMVIGEGPGFEEDRQGIPFVGNSGRKLDQILASVGIQREDVFIANVVKCRPPQNRNPEPAEIRACSTFLHRQIQLVKPCAILGLGKFAANVLAGHSSATVPISRLRQCIFRFGPTPVLCTYHPSALLRNAALRKPVWNDIRALRNLLDQIQGHPLTFDQPELQYKRTESI